MSATHLPYRDLHFVHRLRRRGWRRHGAPMVLLLLLVGCTTPDPGTEGGVTADAPIPVILVSIDTLRADRLPAYGYPHVATPALDAFRRHAILFERAYSHYPLTLPAHTSVLTGLLPSEHGVRDNLGYDVSLAPQDPYLPRLLKEVGYTTGAAVSSYVLRPKTGLEAHFDFYDANIELLDSDRAEGLGEVQRSGEETLQAAVEWLSQVAGAAGQEPRPFFFFFHLYEPHTPYDPPEPFASRYQNRYDGEIAAADSVFGRFVAVLEELGLYDGSLVVVFSDHGEGLGDHQEQEHGLLLYREAIEVPLLVKLPRQARAGATGSAPVQLIDIAPTVLDVLGLPVPERCRGSSLLDLLDPEAEARPIYAETFYPRLHMGWSELTSLIEGDYQYIHGPDPELYDLSRDPEAKHNVLRQERRRYRRLRQELETFLTPLREPGQVDGETQARLASLGYLTATGSSRTSQSSQQLADPKQQIHLLEPFAEAMRLVDQESYAEAVPRLQALVEENPGMSDAWQGLALSLRHSGRHQEAFAAYQELLRLIGPQSHVTLNLSGLALRLGRLSDAAAHAELALGDDPAGAHHKLSEVALARNAIAAAEDHARQAVTQRELAVAPLIQLAKILIHQNQIEETEELLLKIDEELARRPDSRPIRAMANLHYVRGDLLARRGELDAARRAFQLEIESHPDNLDAYARLALIDFTQGRLEEATDVLRRMVEGSSSPAAYVLAVKTLRLLGDHRQSTALLRYALERYPEAEALRALVQAPG